jgi:hypothetical protein
MSWASFVSLRADARASAAELVNKRMSVVAPDVKCIYFLPQGVQSQTRLDASAYYPPVLPSIAHLMSWSIKVSLMATDFCSTVCAGGKSERGDTMCPRASEKHVQAGNTF